MEDTINLATRLARAAQDAGLRSLTPPGRVLLAGFVLIALAFTVGAVAADFLTAEPEAIVAAPFRWRTR